MLLTNKFFLWFYYGISYLGGWVIFFMLGLAAVILIIYDSGVRRLPALGWKLGVIFSAGLIFPAMVYRFTTDLSNLSLSPLANFAEVIFYLGILGGLLPVVLVVGYYITFQGMMGCPRGIHGAYDVSLGGCPDCAELDRPHLPPPPPPPPVSRANQYNSPSVPFQDKKQTVQAWLVSGDGKSYQLYQGETTIGRLSSNDIYLTGDNTVSRQHAKIIEKNGRFRLVDISAKGLTRVNKRVVREPVLLDTDDEIKFGESTVLRFVGTR